MSYAGSAAGKSRPICDARGEKDGWLIYSEALRVYVPSLCSERNRKVLVRAAYTGPIGVVTLRCLAMFFCYVATQFLINSVTLFNAEYSATKPKC